MEEYSILNDVKKMLGISAEYTPFDKDIVPLINTALFTLHQLGIGPDEGFTITEDSGQTWSDLIGDNKNLSAVRTYVYIKVRIVFDPPSSGFVLDALKEQADELEWRLREQVEIQAFNPAPKPKRSRKEQEYHDLIRKARGV